MLLLLLLLLFCVAHTLILEGVKYTLRKIIDFYVFYFDRKSLVKIYLLLKVCIAISRHIILLV